MTSDNKPKDGREEGVYGEWQPVAWSASMVSIIQIVRHLYNFIEGD